MEPKFCMTVNNQEEALFFLSHLKPTDRVLEWGCGTSTIEIAKHVKNVYSIENNADWYEKISEQVPENAKLYHVPFNSEEGPGQDGTYEQYKDYVDAAIDIAKEHGAFDVIFIDGRARVACAAICEKIGHKDTLVFIHDYNHPNPKYLREEYFPAEDHLNRLDGEFTMWKFNIKAFDEAREKCLRVAYPATPEGAALGSVGTYTDIQDDKDVDSKKKVETSLDSSKNTGNDPEQPANVIKPKRKSGMKALTNKVLDKANKKLGNKPKK